MFYIAVTISLILLYDTRNDKSINHLNSSKHTTSEGYLLLFFFMRSHNHHVCRPGSKHFQMGGRE